MAELINRKAVIDICNKKIWNGADGYYPVSADAIREQVKELPSEESEIIKCKDCDWWTKQDASLQGRCARYGIYPTGEWYCAGAERRED